jgi:hypothetical protein
MYVQKLRVRAYKKGMLARSLKPTKETPWLRLVMHPNPN